MAERTDVVEKHCGQIIFMSADNIALNCEFCRHDFFTLEALRTHLNDHFPELQTIIKKEEESISYASDSVPIPSEFPTNVKRENSISIEWSMPPDVQDYVKDILTDKLPDGPGSTVDSETVSLFNNEHIVGTQLELQLHRACKNEMSKKKKRPSVPEKARYTPVKRVKNPFFTCDYCQKQFVLKRRMLEHIRHHFDIRPYNCTYCDRAFSRCSRKNVHERTCYKSGVSNKPKDLPYKCEFCPRHWGTQKQLDEHENTHTGKRPHQCRICDKTFAARRTLVCHVKMHADDKPHKCTSCEKKFSRNAELLLHIREKHLPDTDPRRYFPCLLCDVKLKTYCQYKRHTREHRPNADIILICDHCQKQFSRKDILTQHMKVHIVIKPTCKHCQRNFTYTSCKNRHEQICRQR